MRPINYPTHAQQMCRLLSICVQDVSSIGNYMSTRILLLQNKDKIEAEMSSFTILDNGACRYKVNLRPAESGMTICDICKRKPSQLKITDPDVSIFDIIFEERPFDDVPFISYECADVLVGNSLPNRERSSCEGSHGPAYDGNSILGKLSCSSLTYILIEGTQIYTFAPESEIVEFESPVGLSGVSYPWAKDSKNNIYLLSYKTMAKMTKEIQTALQEGKDPYGISSLKTEQYNVQIVESRSR